MAKKHTLINDPALSALLKANEELAVNQAVLQEEENAIRERRLSVEKAMEQIQASISHYKIAAKVEI